MMELRAPNDGFTDATWAVQTSLLRGDGGEVVFPPGVYRITRPLEIPANTLVRGPATIQTDQHIDVFVPASHVTIRDLIFDFAGEHSWEHAIRPGVGAEHGLIENCRFTGDWEAAITFSLDNQRHWTVRNNHFLKCFQAVTSGNGASGHRDFQITGNTILDAGAYGISLDYAHGARLVSITGRVVVVDLAGGMVARLKPGDVLFIEPTGPDDGGIYTKPDGWKISEVNAKTGTIRIEDLPNGFYVNGGQVFTEAGYGAEDVIVSGNHVEAPNVNGLGIAFAGVQSGVIANNCVQNVRGDGIHVESVSRRIVIAGNVVRNITNPEAAGIGASVVRRHLAITSNVVDASGARTGIVAGGYWIGGDYGYSRDADDQHLAISGNVVIGPRYGIVAGSPAVPAHGAITGNVLDGCGRGEVGIDIIPPGDGLKIVGNEISGFAMETNQ